MKALKIFLLVAITLVLMGFANAQTAITDSGTAATNGPYLLEQSYAGTITASDTVILKSIDRFNYDTTFTCWYKFTSTTDSTSAKILLQASGIDGQWVTVDNTDTVAVQTPGYFSYKFAENADKYRLLLISTSNNGYKTTFALKSILRKE